MPQNPTISSDKGYDMLSRKKGKYFHAVKEQKFYFKMRPTERKVLQ